jgi:hypothetical protein
VRNAVVGANPQTSTAFVGQTQTIQVFGCDVSNSCPTAFGQCPDLCLPRTGVDVSLSGVGNLGAVKVPLVAGSKGLGSVDITSNTPGVNTACPAMASSAPDAPMLTACVALQCATACRCQ